MKNKYSEIVINHYNNYEEDDSVSLISEHVEFNKKQKIITLALDCAIEIDKNF